MQKTIFKIKRIEIKDFKPKEAMANLEIVYNKDETENSLVKEFVLKNPVDIVNKILLAIKGEGKFIVEEDDTDLLRSIYITRIENEEEIEEKMLLFFKDVCEKAIRLKNTKDAREYMRLFDEIKVKKIEF